MNNIVKHKVIVITGAGGVLCREFAKHLALLGAKIALVNRSEEKILRLATEISQQGGIALPYTANVLDAQRIAEIHQQILSDLGPCDILINGAGGNSDKANTSIEFHEAKIPEHARTFFDLDIASIGDVYSLNFMGTLIPTQEFAQDMIGREGCSILNVSSMSSFSPLTKVLGYSSAKAAVNNLTQWLAVHFSHMRIRVNAIAPGFFATEQNRTLLFDAEGNYTERSHKIIRNTPMGRFGKATELLGVVEFLINEEASGFVTGVIIPVDGGFSAYSGV